MKHIGYDTPVYEVHWFDSRSNYVCRDFYTEEDALACYYQIYEDENAMGIGMEKTCKAIFS